MSDRRLPVLPTSKSLAPLKDVARKSSLEILSQPALSRIIGVFAQREMPAPIVQAAINWYIRYFDVDVSEMEHPTSHYKSFDAFFTRTLKAGIHVVDKSPDVAVSPVDGRVLNFGRVSDGRINQVKGRSYKLEDLLASSKQAARFARGHYVTIYLSPRDYHRIHSPVDGRITHFRYQPGRLYPVNQMGVQNVEKLFAVNERLITYLESDSGGFAVVKVGATNVGMITASYYNIRTNAGKRTSYDQTFKHKIGIARGEELGVFHLGSTVVLISEREEMRPVDLEDNQTLRMGQPLFQRLTS
jgi:phosphatidylserine decarboxylase